MVSKRWKVTVADPVLCGRLARELSCSDVVASLLIRRGVDDAASAGRFLDPKLLHLSEPDALPDLETAVDRIHQALKTGEKIAVFGDYDVDGISSTCLLLDFFRQLGHEVDWRLPHRLREGYGLRVSAVEELSKAGVQLLITVDNGSSSVVEIDRARELGMDVVVIDHHQVSEERPRPVALVNPWLSESEGVFRDLAGVGVTFKVLWALCQRLSRAKKLSNEFRTFLLDGLALVALGTVSDVVPLHGENRVLVKFGLRALERSERPGLRALVDAALRRERGSRALTATDIAFRIGPRLNAVGRLGQADTALRLLTTNDPAEAGRLLSHIETENDERRAIEARISDEARERVLGEYDLDEHRGIVLADESWHLGVIGIVASRIAEEFYRPTLLFGRRDGSWRGSGRSIPGVHLVDALRRCAPYLLQFGGHALAAGAETTDEHLPALRGAFHEAVELDPATAAPEIEVDGAIDLRLVDESLLRDLDRLSPHGEGNPEPVFTAEGVEVVGAPRLMGRQGEHLSFWVRPVGSEGAAFRAVAFGLGARHESIGRRGTRLSLLFQPGWNHWQGRREIQLTVRDLRVDSPPRSPAGPGS